MTLFWAANDKELKSFGSEKAMSAWGSNDISAYTRSQNQRGASDALNCSCHSKRLLKK